MANLDYVKDFVADGGEALPTEPRPWRMSRTSSTSICLLPQEALPGDTTCDGVSVERYGSSDRLPHGEAPPWL